MKRIKLYEEFDNSDIEDIKDICRRYRIKNYTINEDESIDVDGDVDMDGYGLTKLPLKFNKVSGDFICDNNILVSLEGSPKEVGEFFNCSYNKLTTLEGGPKSVGGINCQSNQLTSLEGCPDRIYSNHMYCAYNPVFELWWLFQDASKIELFNDLDIVRDNKTIILDRLNDFLDMIGESKVTEVKGYKCI